MTASQAPAAPASVHRRADVGVPGAARRRGRPTVHAFLLSFRLLRRGLLVWAVLLGLLLAGMVAGYESTYPTAQSRQLLADSIQGNPAFALLLGQPRQIDTVGGFVAWRIGGIAALVAAVWGLLTVTRLLRGEEESGRAELVAGAAIRTPTLLLTQLVAFAAGCLVLGLVLFAALVASGLDAGGSAVQAFAIASGPLMFGAVGAVTSQLLDNRRQSSGVAGAVLAAAFLLRMVADVSSTLDWLRWLSPLGWIGALHPFTGADPVAGLVILGFVAVLTVLAVLLRARRDLTAGTLTLADGGAVSYRLLGSPTQAAVRLARGSLVAWAGGVGLLSLVYGLMADDVVEFARTDQNINQITERLGSSHILTVEGFMGLAFSFVVVIVAFFAATEAVALRTEEASGFLDNLLVRPVARVDWLLGRVVVAAVWIVTVSVVAGLAGWAGTAARGAGLGGQDVLAMVLNGIPVAFLVLGAGTFALAVAPRLTAAVAMGGVAVGFLWQIIGSVIDAPQWTLDLSPFHHVAPVPALPVNSTAAVVMLALACLLVTAACVLFRRRDLTGD